MLTSSTISARAMLKVKNISSANGGSGRISMDMISRIRIGPASTLAPPSPSSSRPPR